MSMFEAQLQYKTKRVSDEVSNAAVKGSTVIFSPLKAVIRKDLQDLENFKTQCKSGTGKNFIAL